MRKRGRRSFKKGRGKRGKYLRSYRQSRGGVKL